MRQQVAHRDGLPRLRSFRQVGANRFIEVDPSILDQDHHAGCSELFADGARLEHGLRCHGRSGFDIRESEALRHQHVTAVYHSHRHPRRTGPIHRLAHVRLDARHGGRGRGRLLKLPRHRTRARCRPYLVEREPVVQHAAAHDAVDVLGGFDVGERVAVQHDQVGQLAHLDAPKVRFVANGLGTHDRRDA